MKQIASRLFLKNMIDFTFGYNICYEFLYKLIKKPSR